MYAHMEPKPGKKEPRPKKPSDRDIFQNALSNPALSVVLGQKAVSTGPTLGEAMEDVLNKEDMVTFAKLAMVASVPFEGVLNRKVLDILRKEYGIPVKGNKYETVATVYKTLNLEMVGLTPEEIRRYVAQSPEHATWLQKHLGTGNWSLDKVLDFLHTGLKASKIQAALDRHDGDILFSDPDSIIRNLAEWKTERLVKSTINRKNLERNVAKMFPLHRNGIEVTGEDILKAMREFPPVHELYESMQLTDDDGVPVLMNAIPQKEMEMNSNILDMYDVRRKTPPQK